MKFDSEIVYRMPITIQEWYIRREFEALNIKEFYKKGVAKMDFDVEKVKAYYADLLAKRDEAVAVALADKDRVVAERFELAKEEIAKAVEAELITKAEEPYKHDIELCAGFVVEEPKEEEVIEENVAVEGEY